MVKAVFLVGYSLLVGALLVVALYRVSRQNRHERKEALSKVTTSSAPEVAAAPIPEPSMLVSIHPIIRAIIRSMDDEPSRWDIRSKTAYRDDGLSASVFSKDTAWVYEDYSRLSSTQIDESRIEISGAHNVEALQEALRLYAAKHHHPTISKTDLKAMIEAKLGLNNSVD